jgi:hypothetical protein
MGILPLNTKYKGPAAPLREGKVYIPPQQPLHPLQKKKIMQKKKTKTSS